VPELVVALRESVDAARAAGPVAIDPGLAGLVGGIDPATLDDQGFAGLLAAAGLAGSDGALALPRRMAPVNALLDACPPALREALLLGVLDRLSRPTQT
jgi:sphinganine-1-phosphate aldolase